MSGRGRRLCQDCSVRSTAREETYCSQECLESRTVDDAAPDRELAHGVNSPILKGLKFWFKSLGYLSFRLLPMVVVMLVLGSIFNSLTPELAEEGAFAEAWESPEPPASSQAMMVFYAMIAGLLLGMPLIGVLLAQRYTRHITENPYVWTLKRSRFTLRLGS